MKLSLKAIAAKVVMVGEIRHVPAHPQVFACRGRISQAYGEGDLQVIGNVEDVLDLFFHLVCAEGFTTWKPIPRALAISHMFSITQPRLMAPKKSPQSRRPPAGIINHDQRDQGLFE